MRIHIIEKQHIAPERMHQHHIRLPALIGQRFEGGRHTPAVGQLGGEPHLGVAQAQIGVGITAAAAVGHPRVRPGCLPGADTHHIVARSLQRRCQLAELSGEIGMEQQNAQRRPR